MEYFVGSLLTLITMSVVARLVKSPKNNIKSIKTRFNQSRQHELVKDYLPHIKKKLKTQATADFNKKHTRIIFVGENAYWIEKDGLHKARFADGKIDEENKMRVDIMAMDKVELDMMAFIVDKLTEGLTDDSGNSRH
jgi:hypothetical protein